MCYYSLVWIFNNSNKGKKKKCEWFLSWPPNLEGKKWEVLGDKKGAPCPSLTIPLLPLKLLQSTVHLNLVMPLFSLPSIQTHPKIVDFWVIKRPPTTKEEGKFTDLSLGLEHLQWGVSLLAPLHATSTLVGQRVIKDKSV